MIETDNIKFALKRKLLKPDQVCRLCLNESDTLNIFIQFDTTQSIADILKKIFQLNIKESYNQPNGICKNCYYEISYVQNIIERAIQNNDLIEEICGVAKNAFDCMRPGVDGAPGEFMLGKGEKVITIKPEVDPETTDDESFMSDDSEIQDIKQQNDSIANVEIRDEVNNINPDIPSVPEINSQSYVMPRIPSTPEITQILTTNNGIKTMGNSFLCQFCDKAFTNHADMIAHEVQHDKIYSFLCNICQYKTTSRTLLISHIRSSHDKTRPYICTLCNKGFCRRSDLKKHSSVHTGIRPFLCSICKKCFSRNTNLTKHMRIHSSIKPHVCQQCPRSYQSAVELMRHARTHSEIKPFKCMHCPSSFTRKDKLNIHLNTHKPKVYNTEATPIHLQPMPTNSMFPMGNINTNNTFEMPQLPLTISPVETSTPIIPATTDPYRHSILAAQLQQRPLPTPKTQILQKPSRHFRCQICDKSFTRERDLQQHQALHLDTLFNCNICNMSFNRREKLERHEIEFHTTRYPCGICGQIFLKQQDINEHMKLHTSMLSMPQQIEAPPTMNLGFYSEARLDDGNHFR